MSLKRSLRRWLAVVMLGVVAFAQASVAFSACRMERGRLGGAIGYSDGAPCEGMAEAKAWTKYPNRCLAHCTSDLQLAGEILAPSGHPAQGPLLASAIPAPLPLAHIGLEARPPGAPPLRILLQSFLI
jgi:hypothetical protein